MKKTNKTLVSKQWQEDVTIYVLTITIKYMYKTKSDLNLFSSSTIHRELGPYKMKKTSFEMVKSITLNKHFFFRRNVQYLRICINLENDKLHLFKLFKLLICPVIALLPFLLYKCASINSKLQHTPWQPPGQLNL